MSNDPDSTSRNDRAGKDDRDDAVIAADDTGMLASEKLVTEVEIEHFEKEGDV